MLSLVKGTKMENKEKIAFVSPIETDNRVATNKETPADSHKEDKRAYFFFKRCFDIACSLVALIILIIPILIILVLAVAIAILVIFENVFTCITTIIIVILWTFFALTKR